MSPKLNSFNLLLPKGALMHARESHVEQDKPGASDLIIYIVL